MRRRKQPGPTLFTLRCELCGQSMVESDSGLYLQCPQGHGRLHLDPEKAEDLEQLEESVSGSLFDAD